MMQVIEESQNFGIWLVIEAGEFRVGTRVLGIYPEYRIARRGAPKASDSYSVELGLCFTCSRAIRTSFSWLH